MFGKSCLDRMFVQLCVRGGEERYGDLELEGYVGLGW
jgi:hypothetical protein